MATSDAESAVPSIPSSFGKNGRVLANAGLSPHRGELGGVRLLTGREDGRTGIQIWDAYGGHFHQFSALDESGDVVLKASRSWLPFRSESAEVAPLADGKFLVAEGSLVRKVRANGKVVRAFGSAGTVRLTGTIQEMIARSDGSFVVVVSRDRYRTSIDGYSSGGDPVFHLPQRWEEINLLDQRANGDVLIHAFVFYWDYGTPLGVARARTLVLDEGGEFVAGSGYRKGIRFRGPGFVAPAGDDLDRLVAFGPDLKTPDPAFNFDQKILCPDVPEGSNASLSRVRVDSRGRVYALMFTWDGSDCGVVRYNADGSPDFEFGQNGIAPFPQVDSGEGDLAIAPDGSVFVAGWEDGGRRLEIARFDEDGQRDPEFGLDGRTSLGFAIPNQVGGPVVAVTLPDRRIVTATNLAVGDQEPGKAMVRAFRPDGRPDLSFGNGGVTYLSSDDGMSITGIALGKDGRVLLSGVHDRRAAVLAISSDGKPDLSFGDAGVASITGDRATRRSAFRSLTVDRAGRIVAGGQIAASKYHRDWLVARFLADGSIDQSFGVGGSTVQDVGRSKGSVFGPATSDADLVTQVEIDRRGRIVLAGFSAPQGSGNDTVIARLTAAGKIDRGFGRNGLTRKEIIVSPGRDASANPTDLAISTSGRIFVAHGLQGGGWSHGIPEFNRGALLAFDNDGRSIRSFGDGGVRLIDGLAVSGIRIDRCERILAGGSLLRGRKQDDFGIARFRADGAPDQRFADGGIRRIAAGSAHRVRAGSVTAIRDGRVYLAGRVRLPSLNRGIGIVAVRLGRAAKCPV